MSARLMFVRFLLVYGVAILLTCILMGVGYATYGTLSTGAMKILMAQLAGLVLILAVRWIVGRVKVKDGV